MLTRFRFDLHSAWRGVMGGRWASLVAALALAFGIGVSATAASVAYGGLLRPLPFSAPERLISVERTAKRTAGAYGVSPDELAQWQARLAGVVEIAGRSRDTATLRDAGQPREVHLVYVTDNWFRLLGVHAVAGRLLDNQSTVDDAVLSLAMARSLGGETAVIGRAMTLGTKPVRVVGVLPASAAVLGGEDVWLPSSAAGIAPTFGGGVVTRTYDMLGRLAAGRSIESARAAVDDAATQLAPAGQKLTWRGQVEPLRTHLIGDSRAVLLAFLIASVLVLAVACANVALLLVNRAVARSREFAVRVALGASRGRLLNVAVLETSMLASMGGLTGWWLARLATAFLARQTGLELPAVATVVSQSVVGPAALVAAGCVVALCGAAPLVALRRDAVSGALRTTSVAGSRAGRRVRAALVVLQLATTVVLLTGAGLLGRTLMTIGKADLGLSSPAHVFTLSLPIGQSLADPASRLAVVNRIVDDVRRLPGVASAGIGAALPPNESGLIFTIRVMDEGRSIDAIKAFDLVPVTDGYLDALGARIVDGRLFEPSDAASDTPTVVVSESALKHLSMVGANAVGRTLNLAVPNANGPRVKPLVIGVIKDVRYGGLDAPANGGVYLRWKQLPYGSGFLVVRAAGDARTIASAIISAVRAIDPSMPLNAVLPFDEVMEQAMAPRAARFSLVGVLAFGATLLGVVGLAGALVRSVVERQRELAIRAAIGATPERLLRGVLLDGLLLSTAGIVLGLGAALLFARAASSVIYGVSPRDPLTYAATAAGVMGVALAAAYLPARRASNADPTLLLKSE